MDDYATTVSDLRIALALASGTPIEYVDHNGYETLAYHYMQRAAATRMGISMAAHRRQVSRWLLTRKPTRPRRL